MSKLTLIGLLVISVAVLPLAESQASLRVSNLGQTSTDNGFVGSDSWIAQSFHFTTDPDDYTLDSVQLLMNPANGSPSDFEASIYSGPLGTIPDTLLGSLTGSDDPSVGGVYNYMASGITLSRNVGYFVVLTSSTPIAQGAYDWSASDSFTRDGDWVINNQYATSSDGLSWQLTKRQEVFQIALYATPVPEPTTGALAALGLGALVVLRRRR